MFERNRVDLGVQQATSVPVEIEIEAGEVLKGRFVYSSARSFADVLNGPGPFIEFEPYGGERRYLAKSVIRAVTIVTVPQAGHLDQRRRENEGFDPHRVLGLSPGVPFEDVRQAYIALSKTYHPDRFGTVELPQEVRDYLSAMSARVNIAYAALERSVAAEKSKVSTRVEPIYTSRPRA